tara:strand:+ start:1607 stop:2938 length:1332 start_codon:yes stop_codon:yes gene_type:complete
MTIFALSSGIGKAGVAIIRISGADSKNVLLKLTKAPFPRPRIATLKKINNINNSRVIDEGIILWFPAPESYTGEDMAEIHVHGSKAVVQSILNSISKIKNCRIAEPGEFTKLAFQNGKLDLLKAESIGDLISAETEIQMEQALKIMSGKNLNKFEEWRSDLLKILSHIEAKIDFPDENLPKDILKNIKKISKKVTDEIKKNLDDKGVGEIIRQGFKIAIIGPPNVGKSSLLNYLSNRDVAIVSEIAGTTRDVIEIHLNIDGYPVIISDTAGIRASKDQIEKKGIKLTIKKAEEADLKIAILDPKKAKNTGFLKKFAGKNTLFVINKIDLGKVKFNKELKKFKPILISLKDKKNIDVLIKKIKQLLKNSFSDSENILITRERHRRNLEDCLESLKLFNSKKNAGDFDKAAEDLRLACRSLGKITGKFDVEEILGSIFNDFCIGK